MPGGQSCCEESCRKHSYENKKNIPEKCTVQGLAVHVVNHKKTRKTEKSFLKHHTAIKCHDRVAILFWKNVFHDTVE